jgi:hypothetical protein
MTEPNRDPLVDKLIEVFKRDTTPPGPSLWALGHGPNALSGIPIEEAAEIVRKHYLQKVSAKLREMRGSGHEIEWNTEDWVIITSSWLFPGWDRIDGVRVMPTCPLDWAVFISRSPEFMERHWGPTVIFGRPDPGVVGSYLNLQTGESTDARTE